MTRDDYRDAVGWLYATHRQDKDSRDALAMACDPVGMVDALSHLLLGLAAISTSGQPLTYLDYMRDHLDTMLDEAGFQ